MKIRQVSIRYEAEMLNTALACRLEDCIMVLITLNSVNPMLRRIASDIH